MSPPTPIGLFRGEAALVTGSASNIGRAIALALAREGAAVRCVDVDSERNGSAVAAIGQAGGRGEAVTADLSSADGWRAAVPPRPVLAPCSSTLPRRPARRPTGRWPSRKRPLI